MIKSSLESKLKKQWDPFSKKLGLFLYTKFGPAIVNALQKYGIVPCVKTVQTLRAQLRYDYQSGLSVVKENIAYAHKKLKSDLEIDIQQVPVIISEDSTSLRVFLEAIMPS